jgi:Ca2+-binding EF-hand superfamily protein
VKSKKELFRDQIKRIARSDGGVDGLLAYLDEDEDGLIALSSFMRLLAREKAYIGISESDVESILQPMIGSSGSGRVEGIRVVALLRFMDSKDDNKDEEKSSSEGKSNSDDEEDEEKAEERNEARALTQVVEYDFSSDPETRSLEKKLRGLGRALCKKGMDVEGMFRAVDLRQTGIVRRTDFVEIMSKIGLSILEKGKTMDEAQAQVDGMDSAGDHSEARKNQILQIKRLKGADGGYARTATRAARSMLMNTGSGEYKHKDRGDFKVYINTPSFPHYHSHSHSHSHSQPYISLFTFLFTTLHYSDITHPHLHTHTTIGSSGVHGAH